MGNAADGSVEGRNRLGEETSPYLLQHADNPVHWWTWGEEALAEAKRTGKPILLSVGYAACHWCHVMAHESFEDDETAAVMNELFVNIKVDREERPDIDQIYMGALHRMGEQGGWPLTMFLDADARPFWGGTYFPPTARWGKPGFRQVLEHIAGIYVNEPDKVRNNTAALVEALRQQPTAEGALNVTDELLAHLTERMTRAIDPVHGGIQGAPKFPQWNFFWLMWRGAIRYRNDLAKAGVLRTLTRICQGGIYDHLRGGFARYSVDEKWLVPHFEKMLYDNALLVDLLTEAWRETGDPLYRDRVAETVDWLAAEMIAEGGGFAASLDADSEGEEGKFYVWNPIELDVVLGADDAKFFSEIYDITDGGNFEGHSIPNRLGSLERLSDAQEDRLAFLRAKLLGYRDKRIRPGWDDKVLADWNGLMIASLTRASRVFGKPDWLEMAKAAFSFVDGDMRSEGDRLWHSYRAGKTRAPATASDYANMVWAAIRLYQATVDHQYLARAEAWSDVLDAHYWDGDAGGYYFTADDTPDVIVRMRSAHDDATPNANAIQLSNLVALYQLTGNQRYYERASALLAAYSADRQQSLMGHSGLLAAGIDLIAPQLAAVVGEDRREMEAALFSVALPGALEFSVGVVDGTGAPVLDGKGGVDGEAAAYLCLGPSCSLPTTNGEALREAVRELRTA